MREKKEKQSKMANPFHRSRFRPASFTWKADSDISPQASVSYYLSRYQRNFDCKLILRNGVCTSEKIKGRGKKRGGGGRGGGRINKKTRTFVDAK